MQKTPDTVTEPIHPALISRREAILRMSALLGGIAFVGHSALLTGCAPNGDRRRGDRLFTQDDIAFLDEVADTILPETSTPGAKAAQTGAFMALMVTDTYDERDQETFREGMRTLDEECREMHGTSFMSATPEQRLALLQRLDQEQMDYMRRRQEARSRAAQPTPPPAAESEDTSKAAASLPDQRQEGALGTEGSSGAAAITADAPPHYFRMMKELAMLGYFTSEIGYTQHMRYIEAPGRFDPCVPYTPGEKAWAPHA